MRSSKICRPSTNPMRLAVVALMLSTALCASLSSLDPELRDLSQPSMEQSSNQTRVELLQGVLFAVDKVLDFFVGDFSDINVDGLYGIRLAEGSLHGALKACYSGQLYCSNHLREKLEKFILTIDYVSKKAEPYIEAQDPSYFQRFYDAIGEEYSLDYRPELLVEGRRVSKTGIKYDEERGDVCLNSLSGTGSEGGRPIPKCTITKNCWEFMTTPDLDDYSATHQLLYFIFIDKNDCVEAAQEFDVNRDHEVVRKEERKLCRNILGELRSEFNHQYNNVDILQQDLFLEQTVLCGMLGFEDFFEDAYIKMVLSWQYPSGCFSMSDRLLEEQVEPEPPRSAVGKLLKSLKRESEDIQNAAAPVGTGRKLMRETIMEGGCLSHKTGLAIGTLGAYLRYLMDVLYSTTPHQPVTLG